MVHFPDLSGFRMGAEAVETAEFGRSEGGKTRRPSVGTRDMSASGVQSIEKMTRRHLAYYDRLRARLDRPGADPALRGAVGRAWEAVYALSLAVERHKAVAAEEQAAAGPAASPEVCTDCGAWISGGD